MNHCSARKGYSLVELSVSIGIIFVMMSVFIFCANVATSKSRQVLCAHNLKGIHKALSFYALEHNGRFPHKDRDSDQGYNNCWFDKIDPYIGKNNLSRLKQCPEWEDFREGEENQHSIKMNGGLCQQERLPEKKSKVAEGIWYWPRSYAAANSSKTVLLLDGRTDSNFRNRTDTRTSQPYKDTANRHGQGCNLLMMDGSVTFAAGEFVQGEYGWTNSGGFIWKPVPQKN